jgi:electron transfer flavoprotein beta subunit
LKVSVPCIITTDLRLNEPRYASLPNIMKSKQKPIEKIDISELGIDLKPRLSVIEVNDPPERKAGIMVKDLEELVEKLKNEAKVL